MSRVAAPSARGLADLAPTSPLGLAAAAPTARAAASSAASAALADAGPLARERRTRGRAGADARAGLVDSLFRAALDTGEIARALRPATLRARLEALEADLARLNAEAPEDLFEVALGALADEIANAERLHQALAAFSRR